MEYAPMSETLNRGSLASVLQDESKRVATVNARPNIGNISSENSYFFA
jgi:hypothetical protein